MVKKESLELKLNNIIKETNYVKALLNTLYVEYNEALKTKDVSTTKPKVKNVLELLELDKLYNKGFKGKGVKVGVIDINFKTFKGKLEYKNIYASKHSYKELYGHGTRVASIIKSIAPECELYACETLDGLSPTQMDSITDCVDWCIKNNMDIINISEGYRLPSMTEYTKALKNLEIKLKEANNKGIIICCPSGNVGYRGDTFDTVEYPAKYDSVISVGSVNKDLERSKFSSFGEKIEVVSFGEDMETINPKGIMSTDKQVYGTSFSSPMVSGLMALLKQQNKSITKEDAIVLIKRYAIDLGTIGKDKGYGYGFIKAIEIPKDYITVAEINKEQVCSKPNFLFDNLNIKPLKKKGIEGQGIKIGIVGYGCNNLKEFNVTDYLEFCGDKTKWISLVDELGNAVTSIISSKSLGIAPKAEIYQLREVTDKGWNSMYSGGKGVDWCLKNKMDIVILPQNGDVKKVKKLYEMGTIVIIPSYINPSSDVNNQIGGQMGNCDEALTVEWVNTSNQYIPNSGRNPGHNPNKFVDCTAYGYGMEFINSKSEKELRKPEDNRADIYRAWVACAQVAGIVALLKQQDKTLDNATKIRKLLPTLTGNKNRLNDNIGYGLIKAKLL